VRRKYRPLSGPTAKRGRSLSKKELILFAGSLGLKQGASIGDISGICVELLSELLLPWDDSHEWARDSSERKPVSTLHRIKRLHHNIADPYVQMKSCEDAGSHLRLDRKARTAVWRGVQIHDRCCDCELEPIAEHNSGGLLEHFANDTVRFPTNLIDSGKREVDVNSRPPVLNSNSSA
jgi:hypothetical protein